MSFRFTTLSRNARRGLIGLGGAGLLVAGTLGVTHAQAAPTATSTPAAASSTSTPLTPKARRQAVLQDAANILGIPESKLQNALQTAAKQVGPAKKPLLKRLTAHELQVAAKTLNETPKQLRQELKGESLTQVANAHNVAPSTVENAIVSDVDARIDKAVANGHLTSDRAATLKQRVQTMADKLMQHVFAGRAGATATPASTSTSTPAGS